MATNNGSQSGPKIAVVTGGSRGIGRDTVLRLASRGVHSVFTYNTNHAEAEKVCAEVEQAGSRRLPCS